LASLVLLKKFVGAMATGKNMFWMLSLIVLEVALITFLNYKLTALYYSLDVLYCLPVIQAAHLNAIRAQRKSDTHMPTVMGVLVAISWSLAEAAVSWPYYPLNAVAMNIFTRGVTLTVLARIMANLWKEKAYSRRDALTGLANRLDFFERFEAEQSRSERSGTPYSLLFIDIDNFKMLNDSRGHAVGDQALKSFAEILIKHSRKVDTVSRFGGDEFVLLFPETDDNICQALVARIQLAADERFHDQGWPISLSIGSVTETGKRRGTDGLLHQADERMYSIKRAKMPGEMLV
jgi:diguanylate cyclase (GGDEF)-like protein